VTTRLLILALALLPALAGAQSVSPFPGVTVPVFGLPSVTGSNITPATMGVDGSTCPAPSIYVNGTPTTGIAMTASAIRQCISATAITTATSTSFASSVPVLAPDGTSGAPGLAFSSQPSTGWYMPGAGIVRAVIAGATQWTNSAGVFDLASNALQFTDVSLSRLAADVVAPASGDAYGLASKAWIRTAPSGPVACTSPTVTWSNGSAAFQIDVGTSCTGVTTLVVTMPPVNNAYTGCEAMNATTATAKPEMTASTTTSVTFTNFSRVTGLAVDWVAGDDIRVGGCTGG